MVIPVKKKRWEGFKKAIEFRDFSDMIACNLNLNGDKVEKSLRIFVEFLETSKKGATGMELKLPPVDEDEHQG